MSSAPESLVPGATLLHFKLIARLGDLVRSSVWQAEDTRSGKQFAVKILTRQLPREDAKREQFIKDVRLAAALHHVSIVPILEIIQAGDTLLMVMELVAGDTVSNKVRAGLPERGEFFRIAYQAADAIRFLHGKNLIHGNVGGDSILVMPSGQIRVAGLNLGNLMRRDGAPSAYQTKGSDPRAVSYMSPEQITGRDWSAPTTDIYSLGVVLYELGTGKLPYSGGPVSELARKIVEEPPQSPKTVNPGIENAVLGLIGRCMFKDPAKRYKEAKLILDDIGKVDPAAVQFAADLAKAAVPAAGPAKPAAAAKTTLLFVADVANFDQLNASNPDAANKAAARMQQILGEAVFLFDGQVVDPFGPRMIAELPTVENAIEAARKGEFDFSPSQQEGEPIDVRMLLHAGDVTIRDGSVTGAAIDKALEVLHQLPPLKLHISEEFGKRAKGLRMRDAGAKSGVKIYTIMPTEAEMSEAAYAAPAAAAAAAPARAGHAAPAAKGAHPAAEPAADEAQPAKKKKKMPLIAAVAAFVGVAVVAGVVVPLMKKKPEPTQIVQSGPAQLPPATAATPRKVVVQQFVVEGADPALVDRAKAIRLASIEIMRSFPEVRIADSPAQDTSAYSAILRTGAAGPEIVPVTSDESHKSGAPAPAPDVASGVTAIVQWVTSQLRLQPRVSTADVLNAFGDAVTAAASNDAPKTDLSIKTALKGDPKFLPAQLLAMHFYEGQGNQKDAVEAARQVMALDPTNLDALRTVARASLASGDLAGAFNAYGLVLKQSPSDAEALNMMARYALAANDNEKLAAALTRLHSIPQTQVAVHEPDVLMAAGKIDGAIDKWYVVEEKVPNNPALSLKIGRASVLRRSASIADLELKKLETGDPNYGYHILKAYMAAEAGKGGDAQAELKLAQAGSKPGDDYWTSVADIHAMTADNKGVLDALDQAAAKKEPTASYILSNPLFGYLQSDPHFQKVREKLQATQQEIRSALANVAL